MTSFLTLALCTLSARLTSLRSLFLPDDSISNLTTPPSLQQEQGSGECSPETLNPLRSEAANRFLRWREIERAACTVPESRSNTQTQQGVASKPAPCQERPLHAADQAADSRSVPHPLPRDVFARAAHRVERRHRSDELVRQEAGHCIGGHTLRGGGNWARAARRHLAVDS